MIYRPRRMLLLVAALILSTLPAYDSAHPDQNVTTSYDAAGRQTLARDALGHVTLAHYDAAGRADYVLRNPTSVQYDANGAPLVPATPPAFDPAHPDQNVATLYAHDSLGAQTLVTATGILTGTFALTTRTFSSATTRATRTDYDGLERPITTTLNWRPDVTAALSDTNLRTVVQDDLAGNTVGQRDVLGRWTVTGYDALNRPVTTTVNYEDGNPLTVAPANSSWTDGHDTDLITVTRYRADSSLDRTIANYVTGQFAASSPITERVTQYGYDGQGRAITTTANLDPSTPTTPGAPGYRAYLNRVGLTAYVGASALVAGLLAIMRPYATMTDRLRRRERAGGGAA